MNRRKFILATGSTALGGYTLSPDPTIAAEFIVDTVEKKDPSDVDSVLIDFDKFNLATRYFDSSDDIELAIKMNLEGVDTITRSTKVEFTNGTDIRYSDVSNILPFVFDSIESTDNSIDGFIEIRFQHPSNTKTYKQSFTITSSSGLAGTVLDDFRDNSLTNRDDFGTLSFDTTVPSSSKYSTLDRPEYTVDASGISVNNGRAKISDSGESRMRGSHDVDLTSNNLTWEFSVYRQNDSSSNQATFTLTTSSSTSSSTSGNRYGAYDNSYGIRINDSSDRGVILMEVDSNGGNNSILNIGNIAVDKWVDFKVTYESGTWEVFVNETSQGTVNHTTQISSSSSDYGLGSELDGTIYYDNIRIY